MTKLHSSNAGTFAKMSDNADSPTESQKDDLPTQQPPTEDSGLVDEKKKSNYVHFTLINVYTCAKV